MKPSSRFEIHHGDFATYWFDEEGILNSQSDGTTRTLENTRRTFELLRKITDGKKACLLTHVTFSKKPDKETRAFVARELPTVYKAMALVSKYGLGFLIMKIIFKFQKPTVPMKAFADEDAARAWLRRYL